MGIELEQGGFEFKPNRDERVRLEEPLPVKLAAVEDVRLPAPRVAVEKLDALYVQILEFVAIHGNHHPAYQADNLRIIFDHPRRELTQEDFRMVKIIVRSLAVLEAKLVDARLEYQRQKGIAPGEEMIVMQDADGNWLEIHEQREIG